MFYVSVPCPANEIATMRCVCGGLETSSTSTDQGVQSGGGNGEVKTDTGMEELFCNKEDMCSLDGTPSCIVYCENPAFNSSLAAEFKVKEQSEEYLTGSATFECLDNFYEPKSKVILEQN